MTDPMTQLDPTDFWSPKFAYRHRPDGSILMQHPEPLTDYAPLIADYMDKWAAQTPDHPLLARRKNGGDWQYISYGEARIKAKQIGASLLAMGLGSDRPLMILSEKSLEHGLLGLACSYVGIPYAPLSPAYSLLSSDHGKLLTITALLQPGAVFADDGDAFAGALARIERDDLIIINERNAIDGALSFDALFESEDTETADAARTALTPDMTVKYLFTSGSTGAPKGVINTNQMICAMQAMVRDCYRFLTKRPPVVLNWAPWNHTAAGNKVFYLVLTNGGTYYIDDGRPTPGKFEETLRNLREISCSWYFNVPMGWDMLVDAFDADATLAKRFFASLDMMFYAGAGMAQHTWDRLRAASITHKGSEVILATGLVSTETAPFALACTTIQEKSGNVGVPSRGMTMKLVPAAGKLELRLKGPNIMPGYYGDSENTANAFDDEGFYKMGDALRPSNPDDLSQGFFFDGRIGENFKLSSGTWVAVGAVRAGLVDACEGLIKDAVIVGENETQLGALLVLSEKLAALDEATQRQKLLAKLTAAAVNATGSASRVQRVAVLQDEPNFDRGEITEKGSLNQRAMRDNNASLTASLYATTFPDTDVKAGKVLLII